MADIANTHQQSKFLAVKRASDMLGVSQYTLLSWRIYREKGGDGKWYVLTEDVAHLAVLCAEWHDHKKQLDNMEDKVGGMNGKTKVAGLTRGYAYKQFTSPDTD